VVTRPQARPPRAKLSLLRPSPQRIREFVAAQSDLGWSYPHSGATKDIPSGKTSSPVGDYNLDSSRVRLGSGGDTYRAAVAAVRRWAMFDVGWIELCWPNTRICAGSSVAVLARIARGFCLNAGRIIYTIEDSGNIERFGFAYGTLPGHMIRGEERFLVEWNRRTGEVGFEVMALSRPNHLLSWLSYPMVRNLQARFRRDAAAAMKRAI